MQVKQMWHLTLRVDVLDKRHSNELSTRQGHKTENSIFVKRHRSVKTGSKY